MSGCVLPRFHAYMLFMPISCQAQTFGDREIHGCDYFDFPRGPAHGFAISTSPGGGHQPAILPPSLPKPGGDITTNTKLGGVRRNDTCKNLKTLQKKMLFSANNSSVDCVALLGFSGELF